jgi:hypothetical protein
LNQGSIGLFEGIWEGKIPDFIFVVICDKGLLGHRLHASEHAKQKY